MGLAENDVASLFVDPAHHGRGGGRLLIAHARSLHSELTVSVNEQNESAVRFYEACGFMVEGRSDTDDMGLPYPLLRMRGIFGARVQAAPVR
jgi:putative acetyltransferase